MVEVVDLAVHQRHFFEGPHVRVVRVLLIWRRVMFSEGVGSYAVAGH
jgi:hypothetical protein